MRTAVDTEAGAIMALDVSAEQDWRRFAAYATERWGQLDGLVTCAAIIHSGDGDLEHVDRDAWERTHAVNVTGAMLASRTAVALMRPHGTGSIVHLSSIVATRGSVTSQLAYTTSKGAVTALTRELAVAYAPLGIRVNAVMPGLLATPLTAALVVAIRAGPSSCSHTDGTARRATRCRGRRCLAALRRGRLCNRDAAGSRRGLTSVIRNRS